MPDLHWNASQWDGAYDWGGAGEEWSERWGGSEAQWFGSLLPRIHRFLPAGRVVEIAPGFGRWSRFLIPASRDYIGVDLSGECVESCRKIFASAGHARFEVNDGRSLEVVEDGSCDFVFAFDALVHVEMDILDAYLHEAVRILRPGGTAFIHHSNGRAAKDRESVQQHFRATSVDTDSVGNSIRAAGGCTLVQERVDWAVSDGCIDALTLFGRAGDWPGHQTVQLENSEFMHEADLIHAHVHPYCQLGS